jgi:hypothetical protein
MRSDSLNLTQARFTRCSDGAGKCPARSSLAVASLTSVFEVFLSTDTKTLTYSGQA